MIVYTHTPLVPSDNRSNIAAIVGGVAAALVIILLLGFMSLLSGIVIVAVKLSKRGRLVASYLYNHNMDTS